MSTMLHNCNWQFPNCYGGFKLTEEVLTPQTVDDGGVSGAVGVLKNSNESSKTGSPIVNSNRPRKE